ncbi:23S rRNA (uracil(1939)-C(5))-methyltransferase RlmD [Alicyclobacillus mengziensis]|uniref:23S rRNA (Uracil(1939)-C(5))-methyltransferase RlmD n=1 Tax=Alicyclobacillus mengziensis TaxID=2931921 RepID=A0A9X7W0V4_9BACL|nr:23S rRNA (uracil(1939)-C(5))-methyltransferase RlmD [Alicyclobacillus mengziensis]QSO48340.1 23S rRNA (uracil(1939)-C(5))-methyltransferase RlmD [Alicyclobacillus mengziensis]
MPEENPLQAWVGTVQELNMIRFNDDGDGVARLEDVTVFVPGALPGESVRVRVVAAHKRHLVGEVVEWVTKQEVLLEGQASHNQAADNRVSPVRVTPMCPVFDRCGGCQLQHMSYTTALEHKRQVVGNALLRIGHLEKFEVLPTIGMDEPWRYRNQIQVPLRYDPKTEQLVQGFFASGSHSIIETTSCALVPRAVEETMAAVPRQISRVLGKESSAVHHLIIRHSMHTNEQMVILGVRKQPASVKDLIKSLFHPPIVSLAMTVQENPTGPVWGDSVEILAGKPSLKEQLDEVEFLISPRSFFQVNTKQAEVLTELARQRCAFQGDEIVLDAYCGTGTFSLTMAHHAKEIVGIEAVAPAVFDARENAKQNGIQNVRFEVGVVEHVLPRWVEQGIRFDVAVVDPPRKGCHPDVLQALVHANIPRVVYVSCNPATLARDVRILVDAGYQPGAFQPVDMFPQTNHVECVVSLVRSFVTP